MAIAERLDCCRITAEGEIAGLVARLAHCEDRERLEAIEKLGHLASQARSAALELAAMLRHKSEEIRRYVVAALARIAPGTEEFVLALLDALQTVPEQSRSYFLRAVALAEKSPEHKWAAAVSRLLLADHDQTYYCYDSFNRTASGLESNQFRVS